MTVNRALTETNATARPAHNARCLRYLKFALCAGLYILPFMRIPQLGLDEGSVVYAAVRIVHGQVFARDFFEVMGPGTPYLLAAYFKLFGVSFLATRINLFLTSLGTGLLIYFLSSRVCKRYQWLPYLLMVSAGLGAFWPGISYHVDGNFFALLSVACVVLWQDKRWKSLLILSGVFSGLTTCFLQPKGILLLVAILIWLAVLRHKGAVSISALGLMIGGYLCVAALVLGYFWSQSALGSLIYSNVVWPSQHYGTVNAVPYGQGIIRWHWDRYITMKDVFSWPFSLAGIAFAAILLAPLLFIATLPALLPLSALWAVFAGRIKWRIVTQDIVLYVLCGAALWLSEIHRTDINHLVFGSPLLIILFTYFVESVRRKSSEYAHQLVAICAVWLATFNFIGVLTAHSVMMRAGSVAVFKDDPVLAYMNTHVASGTEVFVYPYHPMYYFLSSTINPTRYSLLMYNYNTPEQFHEVVGDLEKKQVRYVVWDTGFEAKTADIFPGSSSLDSKDRIVEPYLESHYRRLENDDGVWIMERK
jgi:hypothetical protein